MTMKTRANNRSYGRSGFVRGEAFSLASFGVTDVPLRVIRVVDETHGYIAAGGGLLFEFDPSTMGVERDVQLEGFARDGFYPAASSTYGRSFLRGDSLFFVYSWWDDPDAATPRAETALVHWDRASGAVTASFLDGCGDLDSGMLDGEGNLWLASAGYGAAARAANMPGAPETCLIRLPPGETDLAAAEVTAPWELEGAELGDLLPISETQALVRIFDLGVEIEEPIDTYVVAGSAAWGWGRLDLSTLTITRETGLSTGTVPSTSFPLAGGQYVGATASDYSEPVFYRVDDTTTEPGVTLPGFPISLLQLPEVQ